MHNKYKASKITFYFMEKSKLRIIMI